MNRRDPTYLGTVSVVSGAALTVNLAESISSGLSIINGQTYRVGQVGSFVRVPQGYQDLLGVVAEVRATSSSIGEIGEGDTGRSMIVELVGEIIGGSFDRGISQYPSVGDSVHLAIETDSFIILLRHDRFRLGCKSILLEEPYSLVVGSLTYVKRRWFDSVCGCIIVP